jgi:hypothetical protein
MKKSELKTLIKNMLVEENHLDDPYDRPYPKQDIKKSLGQLYNAAAEIQSLIDELAKTELSDEQSKLINSLKLKAKFHSGNIGGLRAVSKD